MRPSIARMGTAAAVLVAAAALFGARLGGVGTALAADEPEAGARLYAEHCAKCHGASGAGDGQLAPWLVVEPPDLTGLSRRHGGEFPYDRVLAKIDGSHEVGGHGSSDMPVWRRVFQLQDPDAGAQEIEEKLRRLTAHVATLQAPASAAAPEDDG